MINRHKEAKKKEQQRREYNKSCADLRRNAKESKIKVGNTVLVRQEKKHKLMPRLKKSPYKVAERNGTTVIAENKDKHRITRNVSHFKRIPDQTEPESSSDDEN